MFPATWYRSILSQLFLFLLLSDTLLACGTGRGGYRRIRNRKMTPLVFRQYIPNVSENTLGASGMAEGAIKRGTKKFEELVVNFNPEIIFKDEEGTGADRVMSQRCKDKLNTLAISVQNQWPGVKLRVTEGWDEEGRHARDSLHYEGRAVDVTTSDKDRSKYGMLARLAVEAGFDYVFYESRGHIHCSVKSDNSIATNYGGCYSANETVTLADGSSRTMSELAVGDRVLTITPDGDNVYSPVLLFFHRDHEVTADFLQLHLASGQSITLTPNHLIYFTRNNSLKLQDLSPAFAEYASAGEYVYLRDLRGKFVFQKILKISVQKLKGIYAPLTKDGTVVVNNVYTSCYAHINHHGIAHAMFAPFRWLHSIKSWFGEAQHLDNTTSPVTRQPSSTDVHWYADILHSLAPYVIPSNLLYDS